jgi:predicted ABC-type exoprotein transport system permease subunit|tara:strand:- start:345 stop:509 length:165 start_codon:yes stop_codon:yes gene_type:complete
MILMLRLLVFSSSLVLYNIRKERMKIYFGRVFNYLILFQVMVLGYKIKIYISLE